MSGYDDEALSLESLFAFVNGPAEHGSEDEPEDSAAAEGEPVGEEPPGTSLLPDGESDDDADEPTDELDAEQSVVQPSSVVLEPDVPSSDHERAVAVEQPSASVPAVVPDSKGGIDLGILALVANMPAGVASESVSLLGSTSISRSERDSGGSGEPASIASTPAEGSANVPVSCASTSPAFRKPLPHALRAPTSESSRETKGESAPLPRTEPVRGKHAADRLASDRGLRGKHVLEGASIAVTADTPEASAEPIAKLGKACVIEHCEKPIMSEKAGAVGQADSALTSASIDERLELLIQKRLDEIRESIDAGSSRTVAPDSGSKRGPAPRPMAEKASGEEDGTRPKDGGEEEKEGEKENAEKKESKRRGKGPTNDAATTKADLSSEMFDEPPQSIREGMLKADEHHRRAFVLKAGALAATGLLCACLIGFGAYQVSRTPERADSSQEEEYQESLEEADAGHSEDDKQETAASKPVEAQRDLSGTVVYRYTTFDAEGVEQITTEAVTFGSDGLCLTSTLEVTLPDEEAVEAFLAELERDYGSSYQEGEAQGLNARVVVDVSANKLDRERYEDALRVSVDELTIVKKS